MINEIVGFEHLHSHSTLSLLDGYGIPDEMGKRIASINQKYLAITDHGMMAAVPQQIKAAETHKLEPIFGIELYVNPFQPERKKGEPMAVYTKDLSASELKSWTKSYHLLALAYNETGYKNLVKLSSWGWIKGFYRRPRVNHEQLMLYKEGIIFTSCCYNSEIGQAFDKGGEEAGFEMIEKYMAMFGQNFYLEFMLLDFNKQKPYNAFIMKAHDKYHIPLIVTNDCHYCTAEESKMQRLMLMMQTKNTLADLKKKQAEDSMADLFEMQDTNLWLKSEEEINDKWEKDYSDIIDYELFKQAKLNTVEICRKAQGVQLDRTVKLPRFENENDMLMDKIIQGFQARNLPKTREYLDRIKEEYNLICQKEFAPYFIIQQMMTDEARRISPILLGWGDGSEAVGPGRGSAGGSLVCYCLGITDVNPIEHDLLFSRFLSPARGGKLMKIRFSNVKV